MLCENTISTLCSSVIGGLIALLGVCLTIQYYKTKDKKDNEKEDSSNIACFYYMLLNKVNLLTMWEVSNNYNEFVVQMTPFYTNDENMFLYNRLQSVLKVTDDSIIREIVTFLSDLQQFETIRARCSSDLQLKNDVNIVDRNNYKKAIEHCKIKLRANSEKELKGILNILDALEEYIKRV